MSIMIESFTQRAERALGGFEKLFFLLNQKHPNHFAVVGEITGPTSVDQWQDSLDRVARHSPLIWSRIEQEIYGVPAFRQAPQKSIPLNVVPYDPLAWTAEAAGQIVLPFDDLQPPLLRATLLHETHRAIIILVAHHSIADGLSLTYLLGDLMRALSGKKLVRSQETAAVKRLIGRRYGPMLAQSPTLEWASHQAPVAKWAENKFRYADGSTPLVDAIALTASMTLDLRNRARAEGTTVHSALAACLAMASKHLAPGVDREYMRIVSPVDLRRRLLDDSDHLGLCTGGVVLVDDGPRDANLWARARHLGQAFVSIQSPEVLAGMVLGADGMAANISEPDEARALFLDKFPRDAVVTNLGVVNLPRQYGPLKLESLWGPAVSMGVVGEQVVGAVTFNNQLHLLHTSFEPVEGLLEEMLAEFWVALAKRC
ncbi:condensation protein [Paraburkholderia sp. LEh10]|uniref:phthiocerol/phthiodiolone dimycocerosyl transferase family protein n=1 Tax=Paraburkholderia sp. LEh10 TaxID=2821353 RepID=UPI001AEA9BF2|nr:condensation domain-containing protein [Paraburkholderia sp. LEh10]MBP0594796.1 condensation protein [Paraburkholderia sp. LEh10]